MSDDDRRGDQGEETEEQRERYRELFEETRTVMPGTQVLFAFLLTAAFSTGFKDLDLLGRRSFAGALLLAALAAIMLMGPDGVPPCLRARQSGRAPGRQRVPPGHRHGPPPRLHDPGHVRRRPG